MTSKAPTLLVILMVIAAGLYSPAAADILIVKADGSGQFATIQAAVDAAVDGDEVHLAAGTYGGDGNRNVDVEGKAITIRSQDLNAEQVIISPGGSFAEPEHAFIFETGEGADSVLQAMTIAAAWADNSVGIVRCVASSPTIRDCVFSYNQGTCLSLSDSFSLIEGCSFIHNSALYNSGIGITSSGGNITVQDCTISDNHSEDFAGGAWIDSGTITGCRFEENTAYQLGGALITGATVEDCEFVGNGGTHNGGALAGSGPVRRCLFVGNFAEKGAAISCGGSAVIEDCTFVDNDGRYYGDCIRVDGGTLALSNSIIAFGRQTWTDWDGSAIEFENGASAVVSCTDIYGNSAGDWEGPIASRLGQDGNISADPLYCENVHGIYSTSPCAPANSGGCGLIGVDGVACDPSSVEAKSWGEIKGMYR